MTTRFDSELDRWVHEGLIEEGQASAIRSYEDTRTDVEGRLTIVAEALGYLGAALAVAAVVMVLGEGWEEWTVAAQLALVAAIGALLFGAGWKLRHRQEGPLGRLTDVLFAGSVAAAGWLAALIGADVVDWSGEATGLLAGITVLVLGGWLWQGRPRTLELIALSAGGVLTALTSAALLGADSGWVFGVIIWSLGILWTILGWRTILTPVDTAIVLGLLGVFIGAQIVAADQPVAGSLLGLASALVVVAVAVARGRFLLLALGSVAVFVFAPQLTTAVFGDAVAGPIALASLGVALVIVAIATVRVWDRKNEP
jgi:hypothetical protein